MKNLSYVNYLHANKIIDRRRYSLVLVQDLFIIVKNDLMQYEGPLLSPKHL